MKLVFLSFLIVTYQFASSSLNIFHDRLDTLNQRAAGLEIVQARYNMAPGEVVNLSRSVVIQEILNQARVLMFEIIGDSRNDTYTSNLQSDYRNSVDIRRTSYNGRTGVHTQLVEDNIDLETFSCSTTSESHIELEYHWLTDGLKTSFRCSVNLNISYHLLPEELQEKLDGQDLILTTNVSFLLKDFIIDSNGEVLMAYIAPVHNDAVYVRTTAQIREHNEEFDADILVTYLFQQNDPYRR